MTIEKQIAQIRDKAEFLLIAEDISYNFVMVAIDGFDAEWGARITYQAVGDGCPSYVDGHFLEVEGKTLSQSLSRLKHKIEQELKSVKARNNHNEGQMHR